MAVMRDRDLSPNISFADLKVGELQAMICCNLSVAALGGRCCCCCCTVSRRDVSISAGSVQVLEDKVNAMHGQVADGAGRISLIEEQLNR